MEYLLILTLPFLGIWAGGAWKYSQAASPLTGLVIGLLCGVTDWWLLGFMLAAWLGEKPGVGHPLGHLAGKHDDPCTYKLERWEPESLRNRPYWSLSLRGLINAVPYLPLITITPMAAITLLYAVSWPASTVKGKLLPILSRWRWSEALRHTYLGLVLLCIT